MRARATCIAVILPLAILACRQIVGIESEPHGRATAPTCGFGGAAASAACLACTDAHCCDVAQACADDPGCKPLEACLLDCSGDPECRGRCARDHRPPGDVLLTSRLDACLAASCANACALGCSVAVALDNEYTTECAACARGACGAVDSCNRNVSCVALAHCKAACATQDCALGCDDAYDAGTGDLTNALQLAESSCVTQCSIGNLWSCVGRVQWPTPKTKEVDVTIRVTPFGSYDPAPGIAVKLCNTQTPTCMPELDHGVTGADGKVTLHEPEQDVRVLGPQIYFDLSTPDDAIVPLHYFLGYPPSERHGRPLTDVGVLAPTTLTLIAGQIGVSIDPTRGHLVVAVQDCLRFASPHVVIETTNAAGATPFYSVNGVISADVSETDFSGLGGFFNVAPGTVTVTVTPKKLGAPSSHVSATIAPGVITVVLGIPTP